MSTTTRRVHRPPRGQATPMGRILDVVPRARAYPSDFKCPAPGPDEASLLLELATLAGLEVECGHWELPGHDVVLYARDRRGPPMAITMPRAKYAFPPIGMLRYLNETLRARGATRRLVAVRDGEPWRVGCDGEVVVWIDADERARLEAAGVTFPSEEDPRVRVEPVRRRRG